MAIRYDPVSCQLWLDPVNPDDHHGQFLCRDHAERLSPPRGWVVVDRRGAQTAIRTSAPVVTVPHVVSRRAARRRWGSFEEPTLEFTRDDLGAVGDVTVLTRSAEPEPPPVPPEPLPSPPEMRRASSPAQPEAVDVPVPAVETTATGPEPDAEAPEIDGPVVPVDDLTNLLKPTGGLLGRAFEKTGHQRSALTIPDEGSE